MDISTFAGHKLKPFSVDRINPKRAFALLFLLLLLLPSSIHIIGGSGQVLGDEKRVASAFPDLPGQQRTLKAFIHELDIYLNDNFGLRRWLLTGYHLLKYRAFGDYETGSANVLFGKDGWLFYTRHRQVDALRGRFIAPEQHLERWAQELKQQHDAATRRGMTYVAVIAPNKQSIYPEKLPRWAQSSVGEPFTDQVLRHIRSRHPEITIVDTRAAISAAKHLGQMYYRTDIHWTPMAGYFANAEIIVALRRTHPQLALPRPWSEYKVQSVPDLGGDLAAHLNLRRFTKETNYILSAQGRPRAKRHDDSTFMQLPVLDEAHPTFVYRAEDLPKPSLPRVLVFRNSFFSAVHEFFGEHFAEAVILWREFDERFIDAVKPDIVVQQYFELQLQGRPGEI